MTDRTITVAVDAMGGDHAPAQNVEGAVAAALANPNLQVILIGDLEAIKPHLSEQPKNLVIRHAPEVIGMHEPPVQAVKRKNQSSLVMAAYLVRDGEADAFVSAGNTGACTAAGLLVIGRVKGVDRPAIATMFPTQRGFSLILDAGANADCKPENLVEFAKMGMVYLQQVAGIAKPSVGLLNIGEESSKGNFLALRAHELLRRSELNFYGNVEGRDLPEGVTDVIVCDGFTGNITLKLMEGIASAVMLEVKGLLSESWRTRLGAALLAPGFKVVQRKLSPENYGGSPLLGIKGVGVMAHGRSTPAAIANAVAVAAVTVEHGVVKKIEAQIGRVS